MRVLGISWVGVRTSDFAATDRFFSEVLGLSRSVSAADFSVLTTPAGDTIEVFGPRAALSEPEQFDRNQVVVGLLVDDMDAARRAIQAAGATLLGDLERTPEGYAWQHFIGPDGNTWELTFDPTHPLMR
jgi:predicted enzyme related to lactoylglutathione lyase